LPWAARRKSAVATSDGGGGCFARQPCGLRLCIAVPDESKPPTHLLPCGSLRRRCGRVKYLRQISASNLCVKSPLQVSASNPCFKTLLPTPAIHVSAQPARSMGTFFLARGSFRYHGNAVCARIAPRSCQHGAAHSVLGRPDALLHSASHPARLLRRA
jgi:hypothetical protein